MHRAGVSQPISAGRPIFTHTSSSRLEILAGQEQRAELLDLTLKLKNAVRIDQDIILLIGVSVSRPSRATVREMRRN